MIAAQPQLREPVFTLNLKSSKDGKLTFGSVDKKQYKGDLMTSPVDEKGYPAWVAGRITLTSGKVKITQPMLFGNTSSLPLLLLCCYDLYSGAGPTTYAVPSFVDDYWKQVPGARKIAQPGGLDQWIYPCVAKLPDVKVSIGETKSPVAIAGSKFKGAAVGPQAKGANPTSFCKCTCGANSTIIPLDAPSQHSTRSFSQQPQPDILHARNDEGKDGESSSSSLVAANNEKEPSSGEEDGDKGHEEEDRKEYRKKTCNDCNKQYCLSQHLHICEGVKTDE
ncbi:MAG: hypothetical protein Q9188_007376, partial [Gyalolechia gomerana]